MAINTVLLTGRMVRDPELKTTQSGVSVCSFSVAVERPRRSGEEREVDFFDCVSWRGCAEFVSKYFRKGDPIGIDGRLQVRNWKDRDGNDRKSVEVLVKETHFLGGRRYDSDNAAGASTTANPVLDEIDESLPF